MSNLGVHWQDPCGEFLAPLSDCIDEIDCPKAVDTIGATTVDTAGPAISAVSPSTSSSLMIPQQRLFHYSCRVIT